ncbi:MAG: fimbrial protein FimV [Rhodoferax sp.]|nr:fimbrial protein FimV [Rhodoferax sp.]
MLWYFSLLRVGLFDRGIFSTRCLAWATPEAYKLIAKSHRWPKTAIAAAAIALFGLSGTGAWALSLGRITVQSALGEPLRAEIDIPDINAEEAASLRTTVAAPEAFVAAGMEFSPVMAGMQVSLQRRPDGRAYIRLRSERTINDPYVDMILEVSWSSGRIVRDYTMLFDPPPTRQTSAGTTLAQSTPQPAAAIPPRPAAPVAPVTPAANAPEPARPAATPRPTPAPAAATPKAPAAPEQRVVVRTGDTASKIANSVRPSSVSLDQMLVALLRSSPDAFIDNNVNLIRAGAVLNVPSSEQAQAVSAVEATRILSAQSKDFNVFRRNLASNVPVAAVSAPDRKASGSVQTQVEEKKNSAAAPDKLTLSKGAIQSKSDEAKIASERAAKDAAARAAELTKNIDDLKKASATLTPATPAAPASAASGPSAPALAVAVPPPVTLPASAPAPAVSAPAAPAEPAVPPKPKVVAPPVPVEEPSLIDDLLADPLVPAGGVSILALLGGALLYRLRQRKKAATPKDSSFLESRLQPDSFFGASGGQRVDTSNDGPQTGSSMVYSNSQLDAADDVDPVAEADVYMAYGRDLQAEEILKDALKTHPTRLAIHTKLLEIYAKRRDTRAFEAIATLAYPLTQPGSPEWTRICEMGLGIDPYNPLYQPGGSPSTPGGDGGGAVAQTAIASVSVFNQTVQQRAMPELDPAPASVDLDLDLDFSLDPEPENPAPEPTLDKAPAPVPVAVAPAPVTDSLQDALAANSLDFDMPVAATAAPTAAPVVPVQSLGLPDLGLSFDMPEPTPEPAPEPIGALPDFDLPQAVAEPAPAPVPAAPSPPGMLEFDLGSLSLDLDPPAPEQPTPAPDSTNEDPLETKLALADEFVSIGDEDGARALIEEVLAEATGDLRAKAQRALSQLS